MYTSFMCDLFSLAVGDELVSSAGRGLCVLLGISRDDTPKQVEYMYVGTKNCYYCQDES